LLHCTILDGTVYFGVPSSARGIPDRRSRVA